VEASSLSLVHAAPIEPMARSKRRAAHDRRMMRLYPTIYSRPAAAAVVRGEAARSSGSRRPAQAERDHRTARGTFAHTGPAGRPSPRPDRRCGATTASPSIRGLLDFSGIPAFFFHFPTAAAAECARPAFERLGCTRIVLIGRYQGSGRLGACAPPRGPCPRRWLCPLGGRCRGRCPGSWRPVHGTRRPSRRLPRQLVTRDCQGHSPIFAHARSPSVAPVDS